jgi:hypothetical protein
MMASKHNPILLSLSATLLATLARPTTTAAGWESRPEMEEARDLFTEYKAQVEGLPPMPCHLVNSLSENDLGVGPAAFSFPWREVTLESRGDLFGIGAQCPGGKCSPGTYASLTFLNQEAQTYGPGEKMYLVPAYPLDAPNGGGGAFQMHMGFISWQAVKVVEPYIGEIHSQLGDIREATVCNHATAVGRARCFSTAAKGLITPAKHCQNGKCEIIYEQCTNPRLVFQYPLGPAEVREPGLPLPHQFDYERFFSGPYIADYELWAYGPSDPPTYYGWAFFPEGSWVTPATIHLVLSLLPFVGTGMQAYECWTDNGAGLGCWAQVGLRAAGDVALGIGIFTKVSKVGAALEVGVAVGDAGQAVGHASRGDFPNALLSLVSAGSGVTWVVPNGKGVRVSRPKIIEPDCTPRTEFDLDVISKEPACAVARRNFDNLFGGGLPATRGTEAARRALAEAYPDYLSKLLSPSVPIRPSQTHAYTEALSEVLHDFGTGVWPQAPLTFTKEQLREIADLPSLEARAHAAVSAFEAEAGFPGPAYNRITKRVQVPDGILVQFDGHTLPLSECDLGDETSQILAYTYNHAYAEEITHALQDNITGDFVDTLFGESAAFKSWAQTEAAEDAVTTVLQTSNTADYLDISGVHEIDPLVLMERSARTSTIQAAARANMRLSNYKIRFGYAVYRYQSGGEFLGMQGPALLAWLRAHAH